MKVALCTEQFVGERLDSTDRYRPASGKHKIYHSFEGIFFSRREALERFVSRSDVLYAFEASLEGTLWDIEEFRCFTYRRDRSGLNGRDRIAVLVTFCANLSDNE